MYTKEELEEIKKKLYEGELRDLAHQQGVRMALPPSEEFEYKGLDII